MDFGTISQEIYTHKIFNFIKHDLSMTIQESHNNTLLGLDGLINANAKQS